MMDPSDEEYKEPINNARRKLEVPMEPPMPCKKDIHLANTRFRKLLRMHLKRSRKQHMVV